MPITSAVQLARSMLRPVDETLNAGPEHRSTPAASCRPPCDSPPAAKRRPPLDEETAGDLERCSDRPRRALVTLWSLIRAPAAEISREAVTPAARSHAPAGGVRGQPWGPPSP
jgi:hypothetical protein